MKFWQIQVGNVIYVHCSMSNWGEGFVEFTGLRGDGVPFHIRTTLPYIAFEESAGSELEKQAQKTIVDTVWKKSPLP